MQPLSKMQQKIYDYIVESVRERGYPPSVREIGQAVELRSPSTVHFHLKKLADAGYIEKDAGKGRAITLTRAAQAGVASATITGPDFESRLTEVLKSNGIQMIILAGFMKILSGDFTSRWPERILNIHPALIPSFCGEGYYGLKVHEEALRYGVKVTGATVHFVNEIPDGGRIIAQKAVEVQEGDTPEILQRRVMEQAEWILLPAAAEIVAEQLSR